jgi:drug/metabolite transporter (DMT)-like permease
LVFRRKELKQISFSTLRWVLLANAIHMGIGGFLSNAGIQYTTAINAGFLTQFLVVTGTALAWVILKEKLTVAKLISVLMIVLGSFFLITNGQLIIPHIGDLLILAACVAWALGGILVRKILKNNLIHADLVSFFRPIAGIPIILLFTLFSPLYPSQMQTVFRVNIFEIIQPMYIILNATFVALVWLFVNRTLKVASASYTAILPSITPAIVAILAMIFLHESITLIQLIGIILILASSFVAHYLNFDQH